MFQIILVAVIVGFVVWIYIHDRREETDPDIIYETWKSQNNIKNL